MEDRVEMMNGNILTELQEKDQKGLFIPTEDKYKILKVVKSESEDVKEGILIYVLTHSGTEVMLDKKEYMVVNVREIIMKV